MTGTKEVRRPPTPKPIPPIVSPRNRVVPLNPNTLPPKERRANQDPVPTTFTKPPTVTHENYNEIRRESGGPPQRIVFFVSHGSKKYSIKLFLPEDKQFQREVDVYRKLSKPKAPFDPSQDMVRFVDTGILTINASQTRPHYVPLRVDDQKEPVYIELGPKRIKKITKTMVQRAKLMRELYAINMFAPTLYKNGTGEYQVQYLITEMHEGFETYMDVLQAAKELQTNASSRSNLLFGYINSNLCLKAVHTVVRAYVAHGFSHYDLHGGNILLRLSLKSYRLNNLTNKQILQLIKTKKVGVKDLQFHVRLFDFDLSYIPESLDSDPEYHLWAHAALQLPESNDDEFRANFKNVGLYHDLVKLITSFLTREIRHDEKTTGTFALKPAFQQELERILTTFLPNKRAARDHVLPKVNEIVRRMLENKDEHPYEVITTMVEKEKQTFRCVRK